jgi:O-acetylhomoserine/O-acetylserine sulfhydrylase-like pyridoxal-dependent enzyme
MLIEIKSVELSALMVELALKFIDQLKKENPRRKVRRKTQEAFLGSIASPFQVYDFGVLLRFSRAREKGPVMTEKSTIQVAYETRCQFAAG